MDRIKFIFKTIKSNDPLIWLIAVNVTIFVLYHIIFIFFLLFNLKDHFFLDRWLALPANIQSLLLKPWTIISYMFFHKGLWHILFNMLWLYWFGKIFRIYFSSEQLLSLYVIGGLAGALFYVVSYNLFPLFAVEKHFSLLLGASAGVLAVVMAIACYVPNYKIHLLIFGPVKLIIIAIVMIVVDIFAISSNSNVGGHIAHLGGALMGYLFATKIKKRKDITEWLRNFYVWLINLFKKKPKMKIKYKRPPTDDREYNKQKNENQKEIDRILDKISKGGYDNLTKEEKEMLFKQKKVT